MLPMMNWRARWRLVWLTLRGRVHILHADRQQWGGERLSVETRGHVTFEALR